MNNFKEINDTHGHALGDRVLQCAAAVFRESCGRSSDFATRKSGDEFIILLLGTGLDGALAVAERIRLGLGTCEELRQYQVTASIGVSIGEVPVFIPNEDRQLVELYLEQLLSKALIRADWALYQSKKFEKDTSHITCYITCYEADS